MDHHYYYAIRNGDIEKVQEYLDKGVKINDFVKCHAFNGEEGCKPTALHIACSQANFKMVQFLISKGHSVDVLTTHETWVPIRRREYLTPLGALLGAFGTLNSKYCQPIIDISNLLYENGANINVQYGYYKTSTLGLINFFCRKSSRLKLILHFLELGADVMVYDIFEKNFYEKTYGDLIYSLKHLPDEYNRFKGYLENVWNLDPNISSDRIIIIDYINEFLHNTRDIDSMNGNNSILYMKDSLSTFIAIHNHVIKKNTLFSLLLPFLSANKSSKKQRIN